MSLTFGCGNAACAEPHPAQMLPTYAPHVMAGGAQRLLARLDQRLPTLTGGARDLPARQQTLRNTIGWSHDLLTAEQQVLFRRLAVFVGGCGFDAAEAIGTLDGVLDLLDDLTALVDMSLVRQDD